MVDIGAERDASGHHLGDRAQQRLGRVAFGDKAAGARLDGLDRISGALVHREDETRADLSHCRIRRMASTPLMPGIDRSMTTRSGLACL